MELQEIAKIIDGRIISNVTGSHGSNVTGSHGSNVTGSHVPNGTFSHGHDSKGTCAHDSKGAGSHLSHGTFSYGQDSKGTFSRDSNVTCAPRNYENAFASDLMSDVLTLKNDNLVLITGLVTLQTIRTAEMADINCIIFVRNKKASPEMVRLAMENGIDLIECKFSMFRTSGLLYQSGLKPVY
jgi:hypothetical protein